MAAQREAALRPAIAFTAASIALVTTVGLRWTFDIQLLRFIQPVVAALLPPIAWICFARSRQVAAARPWLHLLPMAFVLLLSAMPAMRTGWTPPVDLVLAALYFGYGFALLRLAFRGTDRLEDVRLSDTFAARKAILVAGAMLMTSAVVDLMIAADFNFYRGEHAAMIVAAANLVTLLLVACAVTVIGQTVSPEEAIILPLPVSDNHDDSEDVRIIEKIDSILHGKQLYRDPDLTLNRLARRALVPARQISAAVNRKLGCNVSQLVNRYRIEEARRLLLATDLPVTAIMFECGFQTKSNFNREFTRLTGMSPSGYRRSGGMALARKASILSATSR